MESLSDESVIDFLAHNVSRSHLKYFAREACSVALIRLPGLSQRLAVTDRTFPPTSVPAEKDDPWRLGWTAITAATAGLTTAGARPVGMLVIVRHPRNADTRFRAFLEAGLTEASDTYHITHRDWDIQVEGRRQTQAMGVGVMPDVCCDAVCRPEPGDILLATAPLGAGAALELAARAGDVPGVCCFPKAKPSLGAILSCWSTSVIDTQDGLVPALQFQVGRYKLGFRLERVASWLHPAAQEVARRYHIPDWMMLAGFAGEYELVFTVSPGRLKQMKGLARQHNWEPVRIGTVIERAGIEIASARGVFQIDAARARQAGSAHRCIPEIVSDLSGCLTSGSSNLLSAA